MFDSVTQNAIDQELFCAENARLTGNEGKARVCARRAAGIAVRAYFNHLGMTQKDPSAYSVLNQLCQLNSTPREIVESASRLLVRVNPDYSLPVKYDLLLDARIITEWTAEQTQGGSI